MRRAWRQLCIVAVTCLAFVAAAGPAHAGITIIQSIDGVASDARVQGQVQIGASAAGDVDKIHYKLTGPVEIQVVRTGKQTSFMLDQDGEPTAWDTTAVPDGQYKLIVYSTRNGEVDRFQFVKFHIDNLTKPDQTDTVQKDGVAAPAIEKTVAEEPASVKPTTQEPVAEAPATQTPATEETIQGSPKQAGEEQQIVTNTTTTTNPAAQAQVEPQTAPAPIAAPAKPFGMAFANGFDAYTIGSGQSIPLKVAGEMSANQDLLVLAWSVAESRMVTEFAFALDKGPWQIPADQLAKLPAGVNNLQLHLRDNGTTIKRVARDVRFALPTTPFEIGFGNAPASYELGSAKPITLNAAGNLTEGVDVLVLAWSVDQSKMVDAFAFTLDKAPWTIPASKLDGLPEGRNELQLIVRDDARTKLTHSLTVSAPAPVLPTITLPQDASFTLGHATDLVVGLSSAVPVGFDLLAYAWSPSQNQMVSEFVHTLSKTQPVLTAEKLKTLPVGDNEVRLQLRKKGEVLKQVSMMVRVKAVVVEPDPTPQVPTTDNPTTDNPTTDNPTTDNPTTEQPSTGEPVVQQPVVDQPVVEEPVTDPTPTDPTPTDPVASLDPVVRFVDTPAQYTPGSGAAIGFQIDNLPAGGDVLVIAWSNAKGGLVDEFAHFLGTGPWKVSAAQMDKLPAGTVELQLIVRGGDTRPKVTHRVNIVSSTTDPNAGDQNTGDPSIPDGSTANPTPGDITDPGTDPSTDPTTDPTPAPITDPGTGTDTGSDNTTDPPVTAPDFSNLSSAPVGFTKLTKSTDTQVIYVSHSQGKDTNNGLSENSPVKTLERGVELLRQDKPDWLLLKAGDTWEGQSLLISQGGAGEDKPLVIGAYGEGPRPMIIPPHGVDGLKTTNHFIRGLVIQGLHIYGATRDPGSPKFVARPGEVEGISVRINSQAGRYIKHLVIEDCIITHFDNNIIVVDDWARNQGEGKAGRVKVTIRRNIIQYATSTDSHAIGIYMEGTHDSVVEQNLLDHNGYAQTDDITARNKRGHNVYAQRFNGPITFRHNIFSRGGCAGLQLRAGGDIEHNLFVRNATAFWASINDSKANYNVILESDDMNPDVGDMKRGMGIEGWGMNRYELIGNVVARRVGSLQRPGIDVSSSTLVVKNNIVYAWADERVGKSINVAGNAEMSGNLSQESFGGKEPPFVDPTRSVDSYAKTIGLDGSLKAFIDAAASRPRGQWVDELAPDAVCRYIRNGFELIPHD